MPPLIGPWIVEDAFRDEAEHTSEGIERVARIQPAAQQTANRP